MKRQFEIYFHFIKTERKLVGRESNYPLRYSNDSMGNISSCCRPGSPYDAPGSLLLRPSLTTEQGIPNLQTMRPIYGESSEPSSENEFHSAPSSVSPVLKRIPGRPSTPRVDKETGESSNEDSFEFGSENNFCTPISFIAVSDTPSEAGVEYAIISVHPARPTYHFEEGEDSSFDST